MEKEIAYIGLKHMPRKSIALTTWENSGKISSNKYKFNKGDILFGKLRPYFHKVGVAPIDGVSSTDILILKPINSHYFGCVLSYVSSEKFVNYTTSTSTGTRMPRTNWKSMSDYPILIPSEEIIQQLNKIVENTVNVIINNIHENIKLVELREVILPRLMSGVIRIREEDK